MQKLILHWTGFMPKKFIFLHKTGPVQWIFSQHCGHWWSGASASLLSRHWLWCQFCLSVCLSLSLFLSLYIYIYKRDPDMVISLFTDALASNGIRISESTVLTTNSDTSSSKVIWTSMLFDWSGRGLDALLRKSLALEVRPVEHVSWILDTPDLGNLPVF